MNGYIYKDREREPFSSQLGLLNIDLVRTMHIHRWINYTELKWYFTTQIQWCKHMVSKILYQIILTRLLLFIIREREREYIPKKGEQRSKYRVYKSRSRSLKSTEIWMGQCAKIPSSTVICNRYLKSKATLSKYTTQA